MIHITVSIIRSLWKILPPVFLECMTNSRTSGCRFITPIYHSDQGPSPLRSSLVPSFQSEVHFRRMSTGGASVYLPGQSSLGITGVSMPIGHHRASEANMVATSHGSNYDGRGISPVSVEEYEGFKS